MLLDFLIALYNVGVDYHSGQASRGYLLQCQAKVALQRWYGFTHRDFDRCIDLNERQQKIYFKLAHDYQYTL